MVVYSECFPVYEHRYAHYKSHHPDTSADSEGCPHVAMILAPDWLEYQKTAVQANGGQQEDAGKHVEDNGGGDELAQEPAVGPASLESQVNQGEGQGEAAEKVSQGEMEKPNCAHTSLHL